MKYTLCISRGYEATSIKEDTVIQEWEEAKTQVE